PALMAPCLTAPASPPPTTSPRAGSGATTAATRNSAPAKTGATATAAPIEQEECTGTAAPPTVSARHARPDARQAEGDRVLRRPRRRGPLRRVHAAVERAPHRRVRRADRPSSRGARDRSRLRLGPLHRAARARRLGLRRTRHFRQARRGRAPHASADRVRRRRHRAPAVSGGELRRRAVERRGAPLPRPLALRGRNLPPAAPARTLPRLRPQSDESVHVAL